MFRVQGLRFRVSGLGLKFRVWGWSLRFRAWSVIFSHSEFG